MLTLGVEDLYGDSGGLIKGVGEGCGGVEGVGGYGTTLYEIYWKSRCR